MSEEIWFNGSVFVIFLFLIAFGNPGIDLDFFLGSFLDPFWVCFGVLFYSLSFVSAPRHSPFSPTAEEHNEVTGTFNKHLEFDEQGMRQYTVHLD